MVKYLSQTDLLVIPTVLEINKLIDSKMSIGKRENLILLIKI